MNSDLKKEYHCLLGELMPGITHELNNPVGFVGSNLETITGYIDEISNFISEYEKTLKSQETQNDFKKLRERMDLDFVIEDCRNAAEESLRGVGRLKKLIESTQSQFEESNGTEAIIGIDTLLNQVLEISHNEMKYTATISFTPDSNIQVVACSQELSFVLTAMILNVFDRMGQNGCLNVLVSEQDSKCCVSVSGDPKNIENPTDTTKGRGKYLPHALDIISEKGWTFFEPEGEFRSELLLPLASILGSSQSDLKWTP